MFKLQIEQYLRRAKKRPYILADEAGVPRSSIYRYLNNERGLNLSTAEKIRRIIDVGPNKTTATNNA